MTSLLVEQKVNDLNLVTYKITDNFKANLKKKLTIFFNYIT